jgi:hypothetical protein
MNHSTRRGLGVPWPLLVGVVLVGAYGVARAMPEETRVGRAARELEIAVRRVPSRVQELREEAQYRWIQARGAFYSARAEAEQALVSQLREAKERGSLPQV